MEVSELQGAIENTVTYGKGYSRKNLFRHRWGSNEQVFLQGLLATYDFLDKKLSRQDFDSFLMQASRMEKLLASGMMNFVISDFESFKNAYESAGVDLSHLPDIRDKERKLVCEFAKLKIFQRKSILHPRTVIAGVLGIDQIKGVYFFDCVACGADTNLESVSQSSILSYHKIPKEKLTGMIRLYRVLNNNC